MPEDSLGSQSLQDETGIPEVDPYETPIDLLRQVPVAVAVRFSVFPIGTDTEGRLLLVSNDVLAPAEVHEIEAALGCAVEVCLATQADVAFAIRRGYERLTGDSAIKNERPRLGARLLARRVIDEAQLSQALRLQRRSYARLGDILVERGAISAEDLAAAIPQYLSAAGGRLGDFLVERGLVTKAQLEQALDEQRQRSPRLGELLTRLGHISEPPPDE
jgi:bacteriophage N4 adsorption protein B